MLLFGLLILPEIFAESMVWNKENDFKNWRHFFHVKGKVVNGILTWTDIRFDPQMSNRAVTIDPKKFDTLVFTCKVTGAGPKKPGEFYFWKAGSKANPRQSWILPQLICDGKYHTYTVRNKDLSSWLECGTISGIRLDITNSAGGMIEISEIRLEKSSGTAQTDNTAAPAAAELVWNKNNNFKPWKFFLYSKGRIANGLISFTQIRRDSGVTTAGTMAIDPRKYNTISYTYRAKDTGNEPGQFYFKNAHIFERML